MINFLKITQRLSIALTTTVALAGALSLTSCQDDNNGMTAQQIKDEIAAKKYAENFQKYFGKIDPDHTWGLGIIPGDNGTSATTRVNVSNKNQWSSVDHMQNVYHLSVPGWPDEFMYKGGSTGNNGYQVQNGNEGSYVAANNITANHIPAGDVTEEEIEYVSWWFRTHRYPETVQLHWTSFFVQEISSDVDRYTSKTTNNSDLLGKINNVANIGPDVQASDFGIDKLACKTFDSEGDKGDFQGLPSGWDHIKNFNKDASNSLRGVDNLSVTESNTKEWQSYMDLPTNVTTNRRIEYYESSGTEDFMAAYSASTTNNPKNVTTEGRKIWVLVHLVFDGKPDENGKQRHYDGYYLGFDYELTKGNDAFKSADGYYSNWIVKLSFAESEDANFTRRIMCEDLGNTFDFDFNDVVFDVVYHIKADTLNNLKNGANSYWDANGVERSKDEVPATIIIRASGGTLPIYVGVHPNGNSKYEAHSLLDNSSSVPVNVGGASHAPANYDLNIPIEPGLIPIYVVLDGETFEATGVAEEIRQLEYKVSQNDNTPQRFGTPVTVQWMKEEQFIDWGYPRFKNWVQHENGAWCENEDDYTPNDDEKDASGNTITTWQNAWFNVFGDTNKIYQ